MAALLFAIALAAPVAATYDAGLLEETRGSSDGGFELQLSPLLGVASGRGGLETSIRYLPRLVLDLRALDSPFTEALHRVAVGAQLRLRGRGRIFVAGRGTYGRTDLSPLSATAEGQLPSLDRRPRQRSLSFVDADLTAGVEHRLGRRFSLLVAGSYGVSGATSPVDRSQLPLFQFARLRTALSLRASKSDSFNTSASASVSQIEPQKARSETVEGALGWDRRVSAKLRSSVAFGLSALRSTSPGRREQVLIEPTLSGSLRGTRVDGRLDFALTARAAPFIDPVDGSVSLRPEASVQAQLAASRWLSFLGSAAAAPVKGADGRRTPYAVASLAVAYRPRRFVQISGGTRLTAQPDARLGAFIAVSLLQHGVLW